jgi:hypothetical protein
MLLQSVFSDPDQINLSNLIHEIITNMALRRLDRSGNFTILI